MIGGTLTPVHQLGQENWLFVGVNTDGEDRIAMLDIVIESCRCGGLDPYAYLKDALTRLPNMTTSQVAEITPANWGKNHQPLRRLAA